ncbi:hypothetical protein L1887_51506 [Cichorium endivia]|nr:hypothetical protein L1887_51506 [Cichorium endivia]
MPFSYCHDRIAALHASQDSSARSNNLASPHPSRFSSYGLSWTSASNSEAPWLQRVDISCVYQVPSALSFSRLSPALSLSFDLDQLPSAHRRSQFWLQLGPHKSSCLLSAFFLVWFHATGWLFVVCRIASRPVSVSAVFLGHTVPRTSIAGHPESRTVKGIATQTSNLQCFDLSVRYATLCRLTTHAYRSIAQPGLPFAASILVFTSQFQAATRIQPAFNQPQL